MQTAKFTTMRTLTTVLLAFGLLSNAACQKDEINTVETAYKAIVGEWEWEESVIMAWGGTTIQTPMSENKTRRFIFRRDRSMSIVEDGNVVEDSEYGIAINSDSELVLNEGAIISFRNWNTLVMSNPALGLSSYYTRK